MKLDKKHPLVGHWVEVLPWDRKDYLKEYAIKCEQNKIRINARCLDDGERLVISKIIWNGKVLTFIALAPSTNRRVLNKFRLQSDGNLRSEFLYKTIDELKRNDLKLETSRKNINKEKRSLVGRWITAFPEHQVDYEVEYTIACKKNKYHVKAVDLQDGERMKISKIKWDGKALEFFSLMPSTERTGINKFSLKRNGHLRAEFLFNVVKVLVPADKAILRRISRKLQGS